MGSLISVLLLNLFVLADSDEGLRNVDSRPLPPAEVVAPSSSNKDLMKEAEDENMDPPMGDMEPMEEPSFEDPDQARYQFMEDVEEADKKIKVRKQVEVELEEESLDELMERAEELDAMARKPSSIKVSKWKPGMHTFNATCPMYESDSAASPKAGNVAAGKTLWVDGHDQHWKKVYKKSGPVFIPSNCL